MTLTTKQMSAAEYKALRESLAISQQELAVRLGLSVSTISKREQGKVPITLEAASTILCMTESCTITLG